MINMMLITIRGYKSFKRMTSIRLLVWCYSFDVLTKLRWELQDFFKGSKGQGGGTYAHSRKHLKVEIWCITVITIPCSCFTNISEVKGQQFRDLNFLFSLFMKIKNSKLISHYWYSIIPFTLSSSNL